VILPSVDTLGLTRVTIQDQVLLPGPWLQDQSGWCVLDGT